MMYMSDTVYSCLLEAIEEAGDTTDGLTSFPAVEVLKKARQYDSVKNADGSSDFFPSLPGQKTTCTFH